MPLKSSADQAHRENRSTIESLEKRVFLHSGPLQVTGVVADNRGEIIISLNQAIRPSNANTGAVQMYTGGPDGIVGNGDDTRVTTMLNYQSTGNRIIVRSTLPADTGYRIKLVSARIETPDGDVSLDGEFSGTFPSGNGSTTPGGTHGGNFEFQVKNDRTTRPTIRFSTTTGVMSVRMFRDIAPITYNNFRRYADAGDYDNIFFTRAIPGFIVQGGSLQIDNQNQVVEGTVREMIQNEFNVSNTRGTIAMAKQGGNPNSATNQFFFNLADNSGNLDNQNGGFTVFGEVRGSSGLAAMDAVAQQEIVALHNPATGDGVLPGFAATGLTDVPVTVEQSTFQGENQLVDGVNTRFVVTGGLDPADHLVVIRRAAQLMRVVPL